jgi:hypothetical protein
MNKTSHSRVSTQLSESLERKLKHYTLAASAAGAGLLATAPSAEAKVVYTPANVPIPYYVPVQIDLNHDGINDFAVSAQAHNERGGYRTYIQVAPDKPANRVWGVIEKGGLHNGSLSFSFLAAGALPRGVEVGPKGRFAKVGPDLLVEKYMSTPTYGKPLSVSYGLWGNYGKGLANHFLGFKFTIDDETHYGWARLNVVFKDTIPYATLTGYAYETVANKPILTTGVATDVNADSADAQPATLGHLAQGASAIPAWRAETPNH